MLSIWANTSKLEEAVGKTNDAVLALTREMIGVKSDQNNLKIQIQDTQTTFKAEIEDFKKVISDFSTDMKEKSRPRMALWLTALIGGFGMLATLEGVQVTFFNGTVREAVAPFTAQVASLQEATHGWRETQASAIKSGEADASSAKDRENLNKRVDRLDSELTGFMAGSRERYASLTSALTEVETQFCAEDDMRNLMHSNDLRIASLLWQKVNPGTEYPLGGTYYPQICNRRTSTTVSENKDRPG